MDFTDTQSISATVYGGTVVSEEESYLSDDPFNLLFHQPTLLSNEQPESKRDDVFVSSLSSSSSSASSLTSSLNLNNQDLLFNQNSNSSLDNNDMMWNHNLTSGNGYQSSVAHNTFNPIGGDVSSPSQVSHSSSTAHSSVIQPVLSDLANKLAQSIIAEHQASASDRTRALHNTGTVFPNSAVYDNEMLPQAASNSCFRDSASSAQSVNDLLKVLGFVSEAPTGQAAPSPQIFEDLSKNKRKRSEESSDQRPSKKSDVEESIFNKKALVLHQQITEIKKLLHINGPSVQDDSSVLNVIIDLLRKDALTSRSLYVAKNAAPTFWPGFEYEADAIENARMKTTNSVGLSKEQFTNSADYHSVFQHSAFPQAICSLDGRFLDCNEKFEEMTGYSKGQVSQTTLFATMDAKEIPQFLACVESLISGKMKVYMKQRKCVHADGEAYMAQCFISVIRDAETGTPLYFNCLGLPMFDQHS